MTVYLTATQVPWFTGAMTQTDIAPLIVWPAGPDFRPALSLVLDAFASFAPKGEENRAGWESAAAVALDALLAWNSPSGFIAIRAIGAGRPVRVVDAPS